VIACSFAHCKRAIKQFVAQLLNAKEQLSNLSLICSLQKSDWAICCSFAHFKRAIEQFVAHLLIAKERSFKKRENERKMSDFPNRSFFAQKKERLLIYKMSDCPTLLCSPLPNVLLLGVTLSFPTPCRCCHWWTPFRASPCNVVLVVVLLLVVSLLVSCFLEPTAGCTRTIPWCT